MVTTTISKMTCPHCGHEWVPRKAVIWQCPRCQKPLEKAKDEKAKGSAPLTKVLKTLLQR